MTTNRTIRLSVSSTFDDLKKRGPERPLPLRLREAFSRNTACTPAAMTAPTATTTFR